MYRKIARIPAVLYVVLPTHLAIVPAAALNLNVVQNAVLAAGVENALRIAGLANDLRVAGRRTALHVAGLRVAHRAAGLVAESMA